MLVSYFVGADCVFYCTRKNFYPRSGCNQTRSVKSLFDNFVAALPHPLIGMTALAGCLQTLKLLKLLKILKKGPFLKNLLKILKNHILLEGCCEFAEK